MTPQVPAWTPEYRDLVRRCAMALGGDHCTGVPDFYSDGCDEHDVHARTHRTLEGEWLAKNEAARIFKERIQATSHFGRFSPMAQWRYWALCWADDYWAHTVAELFNNWHTVQGVCRWPA